MFHTIPVAKTHISLISSNYLKSMHRIVETILHGGYRLPEGPKQIPQIQKLFSKHKANSEFIIMKYSKSRKHPGMSLHRTVTATAWCSGAQ